MEQKEAIFTELVEQNQRIIHKICRSYADTQEEQQDMFQEVVLQLWNSFDSFKEESKFSTWMYRVALNTAITLFRKRKRSVATTEIEQITEIRENDEKDKETREQVDILYKAIKRLTEIERAIVLLYLEDKHYKEIACTIGISEINARVKMNRIKIKLKKIMAEWN